MPEVGSYSFLFESQFSWLWPSLTDPPNWSSSNLVPHTTESPMSNFFMAAMNLKVIASSENKWVGRVRTTRWAWLWVMRTTDGWALLCSPLQWLESTEDTGQKYSYFELKQVGELVNLSGRAERSALEFGLSRPWVRYINLSQVHLSGSGMSLRMLQGRKGLEDFGRCSPHLLVLRNDYKRMWWIIFNRHTRVNYSSWAFR